MKMDKPLSDSAMIDLSSQLKGRCHFERIARARLRVLLTESRQAVANWRLSWMVCSLQADADLQAGQREKMTAVLKAMPSG